MAITQNPSALILGAGVFGLSAALELRARGWSVRVLEPGPLPHPDAASNDISKIVRMDYGDDLFYAELGERAIEGWERWNREWSFRPFEQVGFLILSSRALEPGSYEAASFNTAVSRGRRVMRLTDPAARSQLGCWNLDRYPDGYINLDGGWSPSGRVVEEMARQARAAGVVVEVGAGASVLDERSGKPVVRRTDGETVSADLVVVASGSWSPTVLPELGDRLWATGHAVFHVQVEEPKAWAPPRFLPWAADIASSGWYGFPALSDGRVKIANHGPGVRLDPCAPRQVAEGAEVEMRAFASVALPELADAPIVGRRLCVYTDTFDSDFLITRHPQRPGVVVATGGSGHGYKFAPVLGPIIADVAEGKENRLARRFGWREVGAVRMEPARFSG